MYLSPEKPRRRWSKARLESRKKQLLGDIK